MATLNPMANQILKGLLVLLLPQAGPADTMSRPFIKCLFRLPINDLSVHGKVKKRI